ncbi:MAG: MBL fold metallo-hydrolase [Steroidobacteraceae bacterium]
MRIEFINHASVKIITAPARVVSDPWYAGAAFNNGWDLICADAGMLNAAADASHVWLSHEHPDHFSVAFFKSTPNRHARVLFQQTADHRVTSFLRAQGFTVDEIAEGEDFAIAPGVTIRIGRSGFYDSWNLLRAEGRAILNLNDCELNTDRDLIKLKAEVGTVDVLLTQFSYAAWKGGRANKALRQAAARDKLQTVRRQIAHLRPAYVIPFASFVYFSHVENAYLNDGINDIPTVLDALAGGDCRPIIMKPGDVWEVGAAWDNGDAAAFWQSAYASIPALPLHRTTQPVPLAELKAHCRLYRQRIFANNSKWLMRLASLVPGAAAFRPLLIQLTDLDLTVRFSFFDDLRELPAGAAPAPHVEMSSESLDFIFRNDFGYDTLTVNGRFEASTDGFARMTKNFAVGSLNALGLSLRPSLIANADVVLLLLGKLRAFIRRMDRSQAAAG